MFLFWYTLNLRLIIYEIQLYGSNFSSFAYFFLRLNAFVHAYGLIFFFILIFSSGVTFFKYLKFLFAFGWYQ